ncbi:diguanylate cyclase (GGDEF)-like protein [Catenulispora sp. GAS73]|uniref:diguanylate cyclase domain-containing protein n=1 Tax=Catenulispora sp. GAS73 TaxID=3156269 RepID=UPI00351961DB
MSGTTIAVAVFAGFVLGLALSCLRLHRMGAELDGARWLAEHDPLTRLPNRTLAQCIYQQEMAARGQCGVVLLDLDEFKAVNDTWGHEAGDVQLSTVAQRLNEACKPIGATAARLAGDEFLLLLPACDRVTIDLWMSRTLAQLSAPTVLRSDQRDAISRPRASAGIALPEPDSTWSDQLRRADIALYQAKASLGAYVFYAPEMRPSASNGGRLRELATSNGR